MKKTLGILIALLSIAATNRTYHALFNWDVVTNATSYNVVARSNGVLIATVPTLTNWAVVSNLPYALDGWRFTCVSSNEAGLSDESQVAVLRLITLVESDTVGGPWRPFTTPVFEPTNSGRYFWPSNWRAEAFLKRD